MSIRATVPLKVPDRATSYDDVLAEVSCFYNVPLRLLLGRGRSHSVTMARHVAMYIGRKQTRHSLEEVGQMTGGRDHTTVMNAVAVVTARMVDDPYLELVVRTLMDTLANP